MTAFHNKYGLYVAVQLVRIIASWGWLLRSFGLLLFLLDNLAVFFDLFLEGKILVILLHQRVQCGALDGKLAHRLMVGYDLWVDQLPGDLFELNGHFIESLDQVFLVFWGLGHGFARFAEDGLTGWS